MTANFDVGNEAIEADDGLIMLHSSDGGFSFVRGGVLTDGIDTFCDVSVQDGVVTFVDAHQGPTYSGFVFGFGATTSVQLPVSLTSEMQFAVDFNRDIPVDAVRYLKVKVNGTYLPKIYDAAHGVDFASQDDGLNVNASYVLSATGNVVGLNCSVGVRGGDWELQDVGFLHG